MVGELSEATLLKEDGVVKMEAGKRKERETGAESLTQQGWTCRSREENQINIKNGIGCGAGHLRKMFKRKLFLSRIRNQGIQQIMEFGNIPNLSHRDFTGYRAHLHL